MGAGNWFCIYRGSANRHRVAEPGRGSDYLGHYMYRMTHSEHGQYGKQLLLQLDDP